MTSEPKHEAIIDWLNQELKPMLEASQQATYVYVCDEHKICNQKFASMLGYRSAQQWTADNVPFLDGFVAEGSRDTLLSAYQAAMNHGVGSHLEVVWRKKTGGTVNSQVILVPLSYQGQRFALHFIS
jgi:hypothetical protein